MGLVSVVRHFLGRLAYATALDRLADAMISRADGARDARRFRDAAILYDEALKLRPNDGPIQVQCGHMFKESGDLLGAEAHYREADRLMPDDADLALQMGHFFKVKGGQDEAEHHYRKALRLRPGWPEPLLELSTLQRSGAVGAEAAGTLPGPTIPSSLEGLLPELVAIGIPADSFPVRDGIELLRLGRVTRRQGRAIRTLRGVEAIRGLLITSASVAELQVLVDDHPIELIALHPEALAGSTEQRKYVFNIWHDFSAAPLGPALVTLHFRSAHAETIRLHREHVVVAKPSLECDYPSSDAFVPAPEADGRSLEARINTRPSMVRSARRKLFAKRPKTILVQRIDQLGDMVCSIPAIRRLREIFPDARVVGLLSADNADLAASLALFDEIIVADFPDDPVERRRTMALDKQAALREKLEAFKFDLAIDLSDSAVSRPLLLLSGAPVLYGFRHNEFSWLTAGLEGVTRDPVDGLECVSHSAKVMGLIEWLNAISTSHAAVVRRADLTPAVLAPLGLSETDRFVVLHTGARLAFSRWPHYQDLATLILEQTDLKVVMMTGGSDGSALPEALALSNRFTLIDRRLSFDEFDGLASFCQAFVGNDSGPKHLAALRGTQVVSIHMARNNWNEWGQENEGVIISRRVPCAGCAIHRHPEECGKGFACITHITPQEVFGALLEAMAA